VGEGQPLMRGARAPWGGGAAHATEVRWWNEGVRHSQKKMFIIIGKKKAS